MTYNESPAPCHVVELEQVTGGWRQLEAPLATLSQAPPPPIMMTIVQQSRLTTSLSTP